MLLSIINILLNPFSFLLFITFSFRKESSFFTKEGTNVIKLKLVPYLFFSLIYLIIVLGLAYLCSIYVDFNIWKIFVPKNLLISAITWMITVFTLRTYLKGMEGNIMGFIFFPLLALSTLTLFVFSFSDILSYHKFLSLNLPVLKLNFWLRLLLHSFMPFYILIYLNSNKDTKEKDWIAPILSILILQMFFFGINWILIYLSGNSLSLSLFFGEGQTILYYLPMLGGFLCYLLFFISKMILSKKGKQNKLEIISYYIVFLTFGFIILEIINYLNLIIPFFN